MPPVDRLKPTRGRSSESSCSLMEFMREFPDDNACLEWLWRTRHSSDGETAHCPKCDQDRTFKRYKTAQRRQSWTCTACGHHVHPTAGTIFHKSSTSLHLWFYAMYLITSTRCGISAKHLERELGDQYKPYERLGKKGYTHRRIKHQARVYVDGDVHTQTIDGFFGLFKSGVRGAHHAVSHKWLQGYLNEWAWRYNRREDGNRMFRDLIETAAERTV